MENRIKTNPKIVFLLLFIVAALVVISVVLEVKKSSSVPVETAPEVTVLPPIALPDATTQKGLEILDADIQQQQGLLKNLRESLDVELEADLDLRLKSSVF